MIQRFGRPSRVKNLMAAGFIAVTALLYAIEDAPAGPTTEVEAATVDAPAAVASTEATQENCENLDT